MAHMMTRMTRMTRWLDSHDSLARWLAVCQDPWLKSFLVCFQPTNRLWIDYYFIGLQQERNVFLLDKAHGAIAEYPTH